MLGLYSVCILTPYVISSISHFAFKFPYTYLYLFNVNSGFCEVDNLVELEREVHANMRFITVCMYMQRVDRPRYTLAPRSLRMYVYSLYVESSPRRHLIKYTHSIYMFAIMERSASVHQDRFNNRYVLLNIPSFRLPH